MQLLKTPDLGLRKRVETEIRERLPTPEIERLSQDGLGPGEIPGFQMALTLGTKPLEGKRVEFSRLYLEHVSGRSRENPFTADSIAQARNIDLNGLGRVLRRSPLPHLVDNPVGRERLIRVYE